MNRFFFKIPMISTTKTIVLASQSPRRANLLRQIGVPFIVSESSVDEYVHDNDSPVKTVKDLSLKKALNVSQRFTNAIIIGADTIVVLDNVIYGKPNSPAQAALYLRALSGRTHQVYTGFALVDSDTQYSYIDYEKTDVTFRSLEDSEIASYVNSGSPLDKAGAYGIQDDFGAVFIDRIDGCFYTVVGFPLAKFYLAMKIFLKQVDQNDG
jgi:septum formation protein